ncbi:MAG: gfo/Idh/MocA family oxidoreductase [Planctomycetes bacterium]|nr:gfo/Idh/MocA family oxidoreductase [Planctomycetota bacterium]
MSESTKRFSSRRTFLKATGSIAASSALAGTAIPTVHAGEDNTIRIALIGCGGRGTGAAVNALSVKNGPIKLVAMADIFDYKLAGSYKRLKKHFPNQVDVPEDRRFIGFDAYKKAMDCLKPGDVAIFATYPAFRWVHFTYAIQKGLNVFMEKPVTVDGPTTRRMLKLAEQSEKKNLKVGVGLMIRHCRGRQELHKRIRDGEIGDIIMMRAYRMSGPISSFRSKKKPEGISELLWQIKRSVSFLWASGGCFNDFYIHQIDECSWMKGAWPVRAKASGGRHYRDEWIDQNFDTYSVEYTYADGTKLFFYGRCMSGCYFQFASYAHGTKGAAIVTTARHTPGRVRTFKGHNMTPDELIWAFPQPEQNPYQLEWDDLITAIREDTSYNEVKRGAEASLVSSMGRMAAHTGRVITFDQMLNCEHEFAPDVDKLTMDSPAPLPAGPDGKYPVPQPGIITDREY